MASISSQPNGRRTIQFLGTDGKRRSIRLGKVSLRQAETIKIRVEQLVGAAISGHAPDDQTSRWVAGLDDLLVGKLAQAGLVPKRESSTLGPFVDGYIESRTDVKAFTKNTYISGRASLLRFFGPDKPLRDVNEGDAEDYRRALLRDGYAENTVRLHCRVAKQFFRAAQRRRLIAGNPFEILKGLVSGSNQDRQFFITRDDAENVLDACPDPEWRLIFALSRFAGLRCPSEHLELRWDDIDWGRERMTIRSPKTDHHDGKESRIVPIFPELRPHLDAVWESLKSPTEFVITRYRKKNANLRTQLLRILKRAGVKPWPKLFHNLRSTRETELMQEFPIHVVCEWIGNSQLIAAKHYLQVTDQDYDRALQKAVQETAEPGCIGQDEREAPIRKAPENQGLTSRHKSLRRKEMRLRGVEPPRP